MEGITQSFEVSGTKNMNARVTVTETYDILTNSSDISIALELMSTKSYGWPYFLQGDVTVDNTQLVSMSSAQSTHKVYIDKKNVYYPVEGDNGNDGSPWTLAGIQHDPDGVKTITVSFSVSGFNGGNGASGFSIKGSATISLTHIPRASTIGATDANIGSTSVIAVGKRNADYTHSIRYDFGQLSGYIAADGSTVDQEVKISPVSIAFVVPVSFYEQIPNAKSGVCTLTCKTYSGDSQIGEAQTGQFVATADVSSSGPQVSGFVEDTNPVTVALTGNAKRIVRYASNALCSISATARNAASIESKSINGEAVSEALAIDGISVDTVSFSATDSRGYVGTAEVLLDMVPYIPVTCVATGGRLAPTDGTARINLKGNYYNGAFGETNNAITARYRVGSNNWVPMDTTVTGNSYTAEAVLAGLDYTKSFTITAEVTDRVGTVTQQVVIGKGIPVFDWGENDFNFHVPVSVSGSLTIGNTTISEDQLTRLIALLE